MKTLFVAGAVIGAATGAVMGAMANPSTGILFGSLFGGAIGLFSGHIMAREDQRKTTRNRELDDIIGTTSGSLGRSSLIPPLPSEEVIAEARNRRWVAEWMTPMAPRVTTR